MHYLDTPNIEHIILATGGTIYKSTSATSFSTTNGTVTSGAVDVDFTQFKNKNLHNVAFSAGLTQALYNGRFLWLDPSTPSNFSPFSMIEAKPIQLAEQQNCHFILHLILTQGKGCTLDKIKASNKQIVKALTTYIKMIQQLKFFSSACDIFFGKHSAATSSIKALINVIKIDKQLFKAQEVNWEFASQFVFAVDKRMQIWFDSISNASDQLDVDNSPLNFSDQIKSVKYMNFFLQLPPSFAKQDNNSKKRPGKGQSKGV
jgi:hypothetical protein